MSGYHWSRTNSEEARYTLPYPSDEWVPARDIRFENGKRANSTTVVKGGHFSEETRVNLSNAWVIVHAGRNAPYDVVGQFKVRSIYYPLFSKNLMSAVNNLDENLFEFVEINNCWHAQTNAKFEGSPYYFANLLPRQQSWVREKMEFMFITTAFGTKNEYVKHSNRVVNAAISEQYPVWRDSSTGDIICNDTFKDCLSANGCRGWRFREIQVL
jgi:hypothetical protein